MKLTQEEKEQLAALVSSPAWKSLIKAIDMLIEKQGDRVLSSADSDLHSERKKYDGMQTLKMGIESLRGK